MDLAQHSDQPVTVAVAGRDFRFSELTLEACGRLQAWIKANVPHPLAVVKDQLDGFAPADRAALLDQARKDAAHWPPAIGTGEAMEAFARSRSGIAEVLFEGLAQHDPDATREDAEWLMKRIRRDEAASRTILGTLFGLDLDEGGPPKG